MSHTALDARRIAARCPRCRGRLFFEIDHHGSYLTCVACGCVLEERTGHQAARADTDRASWWRHQSA